MMTQEKTLTSMVQDALRYLANRCDYATEKDGAGFNSLDTWAGHLLASQEELSPAETYFAGKLVYTYRKQLKRGGLEAPALDELERYAKEQNVIEYTRKQLREKKREEAREAREQAREAKKVEEQKANPDRVYIRAGRIVVKFGWNQQKVAAIQALKKPDTGWEFNKWGEKEWSFNKTALPAVLEAVKAFDDFEYSEDIEALRLEAEAEAAYQKELAELEEKAREAAYKAARENVYPYLKGGPLAGGRVLFEHQREAVDLLIKGQDGIGPYMLLAHDMGLGKSLSSLVAAKAFGLPVFIICPASLKINWLREAEEVRVQVEVYSWAKLPEPLEDQEYVVIADESHYAQNLRSNRTQAFLSLVEKARAVFCLTGTPLKNGRPSNLFPLLKAIRHPLGKNKAAYEKRYCDAHMTRKGRNEVWDVTGAANLDELHRKTKGAILYKKKQECLKDLPPKTRIMRIAQVSAEQEKEYAAFLQKLKQDSKERLDANRVNKVEARVKDLLEAEFSEEEAGNLALKEIMADEASAQAIVEMGELRHAGSMAKVENAVELAQEVLEQGEQVVLFTAYKDSAEAIAKELRCEVFQGSVSTDERQRMVDDFQAGKRKALVCTLGAGGVGITLTAAQTVILVDRPWTPGDAVQSEDRLHRIGQTGNVTAIWLQYGKIDQKVDMLLQEKQERIDLVLEGKRKTMRGVSKSVLAEAKRIMQEVLE